MPFEILFRKKKRFRAKQTKAAYFGGVGGKDYTRGEQRLFSRDASTAKELLSGER